MLKPLTVNYKGFEITLECTHKKVFPPPQMYGATPNDIDTLWRQGVIDQNQYQHLKVWQENCGIMFMGPKCLDCHLALKQNPRPGRPHVIETESWLAAKERMHWQAMAANKVKPSQEEESMTTSGSDLEEVSVMEEVPIVEEVESSIEEEPSIAKEEDKSFVSEGLGDDILNALAED